MKEFISWMATLRPLPHLLDLIWGYIRLTLEVPKRLLPDQLNTAALAARRTHARSPCRAQSGSC